MTSFARGQPPYLARLCSEKQLHGLFIYMRSVTTAICSCQNRSLLLLHYRLGHPGKVPSRSLIPQEGSQGCQQPTLRLPLRFRSATFPAPRGRFKLLHTPVSSHRGLHLIQGASPHSGGFIPTSGGFTPFRGLHPIQELTHSGASPHSGGFTPFSGPHPIQGASPHSRGFTPFRGLHPSRASPHSGGFTPFRGSTHSGASPHSGLHPIRGFTPFGASPIQGASPHSGLHPFRGLHPIQWASPIIQGASPHSGGFTPLTEFHLTQGTPPHCLALPSSGTPRERFPQDPDWLKITWLPAAHNPPPPRFTISYILCSQGKAQGTFIPFSPQQSSWPAGQDSG